MHRMGSSSSVVFNKTFVFYIFPIWYCAKTMSCIGSHLGFRIGIRNPNFLEDLQMIIPGQFGFNCSIVRTYYWPSGFGEEAWKVKSLQTTDDGLQVMAIVPMDLWSRWTKKLITNSEDHANGHQQRYSAYQYNQIKVIWYGANPCWIWCW